MRRYSHAFRVLMDQELFNLLAEASTKTGIPKSRFVRYAIQPFSYTELAPGTTDWNDVYRTDPDPEHPLKRGRQLNVMLTGDEYEMLCRAAFKLGIARSAWVRERVYALLCRSYADELSPLTDAIHTDKDGRNPHAHILVANRRIDPDTQAFLDAHGGHGFAGAEGYVSDWPSAA